MGVLHVNVGVAGWLHVSAFLNALTVNCCIAVVVDLRTCCCCAQLLLSHVINFSQLVQSIISSFKIHSIIISRMIVSNEDIGLSLSGD